MSVQDGDITTPVNPPDIGSQGDTARSLQVNLSHLLSYILTSKFEVISPDVTHLTLSTAIYKPDMTPLVTFLEQTRSILHTLAYHAQEIESIVALKFNNSLGSMPRGTHYLTMLYHQVRVPA